MATPHTAGTIALMLSAKPTLAGNFNAVLDALNKTAVDRPDDQCGTPDPSDNDPNYVYGEGRIDAKAAVDLVKSGGTLAGTVTDVATTAPIADARVTATDGNREFTATTDATGHYELFLAAGDYVATGQAFGYGADTAPLVTIVTDQTTTQDFPLAALPAVHRERARHGRRGRQPDRGRQRPRRGHAGPAGQDRRVRRLQPRAADRHVHPARVVRRLHRDRLRRHRFARPEP